MAAGESDAARAIQALGAKWQENFNSGQADRLVADFYDADACLLPPNHPMVTGRSAIHDLLQQLLQAGLGDIVAQTVQIVDSGDLAYRVGSYRLGRPAPDVGKFVEVYRRQPDGSWRCVVDIFNSDQPTA